jgi:hypothetical protein
MKLALPGSLVVACALVASSIAKPLPKGRWNAVLVKDATWTLPVTEKNENGPTSLTVKVVEVRSIAGAQVARIDYEVIVPGDEECFCDDHSLPAQIAVTKKGVYLFADDATDEQIKKALKKKPMFPAAGSTAKFGARKDGSYAIIPKDHSEAACYGYQADPSCGSAPCDSWICLDDKGVVAAGDFGGNGYSFGFELNASYPGQ